jgi:hypothetical protein
MSALDIEPLAARARFGRAPFLLQHRLTRHALFAPARLEEIALEEPRNDAAYGVLLRRCLDEIRAAAADLAGGMHAEELKVVLAPPGALTPCRAETEESFVLQVRGRQALRVFERSALSAEELERLHARGERELVWREARAAPGRSYNLMPGLGVHVPVAAPYWVQTGPEESIAVCIGFRTRASARAAHTHRMNAFLRRLGFEPTPVGVSPWLDRLKQLAYKIRRARPLAAPFVLRTASSGDRR